MDRLNFVRDGESRLPPGFRFQPTDEEIVFQYLSRKIFSHPLPAQIIPEIDVFSFDPWELQGDSDQEKYFFSKKEGNSSTSGGFWKAMGSAKRIVSSKRMPIVGIRKCLRFYKRGSQSPTDWIMHHYCIAFAGNPEASNSQGSLIRVGDWTLCHIFLKKRSMETQGYDDYYDDDNDDDIHTAYDFSTADYLSDTDSSSASSSSPHYTSSNFSDVSSNLNI